MFLKNTNVITVVFVSLAILSGCSKYNKVLKSTDLDLKYNYALELYEQEKYYKAMPLIEELVSVYRGHKRSEKLNYIYAYTDFSLGDYYLASYRFSQFPKTFPTSEFAEECQFMSAYCQYLMSPKPSLDQTTTLQAIAELQAFIERYPTSVRVDTCNTLVVTLERKLEEKAFAGARQYHKMENYRAARVSYKSILKDFPDTKYREDIYYNIFESDYLLAIKSVDKKKQERIEQAMKSYKEFIKRYPESKKVLEGENRYNTLLKVKEKINQKENS